MKNQILVVEDREDSRKLLTYFLALEGYRVFDCSTLSEARRLLTSKFFDLIITDLNLPDGHGRDLSVYGTPAIAVTAETSDEGKDKSKRAGFVLHLDKPVDLEKLLQAVELILTPDQGPALMH